ncbi:HNH endonuclease family protein [Streptomyces bikiniensis]|uniref:HNH endonuclease family protein n=1 Tax=Streptomyces bikiniensis TaxID=1896 RepID=UPI0004C03FAD|nr:HNH endonuclease family protein [Streptomyces bikiniensis]
MITNMLRGAAAFCLALTSLTLPSPTATATATRVPTPEVLPLEDAVGRLPVAEEDRTGYTRDSFQYWNTGLDAADGCNTRDEVLLAEAVQEPTVTAGCKLSGGKWGSYYDGVEVGGADKLAIDHMVPLAEAWESGAGAWDARRREAYANDQGAAASLVAVTARTVRSKADQDPAAWVPPLPEAHCRYTGEWTATKLRWGLAADQSEAEALKVYAEACETTIVHYNPAP